MGRGQTSVFQWKCRYDEEDFCILAEEKEEEGEEKEDEEEGEEEGEEEE